MRKDFYVTLYLLGEGRMYMRKHRCTFMYIEVDVVVLEAV